MEITLKRKYLGIIIEVAPCKFLNVAVLLRWEAGMFLHNGLFLVHLDAESYPC